MVAGAPDPKWPKLLSLAAHELRSPLTVISGYIRMLLKDQAGPVSAQQRRLLELVEESCGRLSALVAEISELARLEAGSVSFSPGTIDVHLLLLDAVGGLAKLSDRDVSVEISVDAPGPLHVQGDAARLTAAFSWLLAGLRRELVSSDRLRVHVSAHETDNGSAPSYRITIGDPVWIARLTRGASELADFDEWRRGGNGLSLANARRIIEAHGGQIWGSADGERASAIVSLPALAASSSTSV
jgi:signal transduction histidine kinase